MGVLFLADFRYLIADFRLEEPYRCNLRFQAIRLADRDLKNHTAMVDDRRAGRGIVYAG